MLRHWGRWIWQAPCLLRLPRWPACTEWERQCRGLYGEHNEHAYGRGIQATASSSRDSHARPASNTSPHHGAAHAMAFDAEGTKAGIDNDASGSISITIYDIPITNTSAYAHA